VKLVRSYAPLRRVPWRSLLLHFYRVRLGVHEKVEMQLLGFEPKMLDVTTDMLTIEARLRLPRDYACEIKPIL
jgi:hypothetical protein